MNGKTSVNGKTLVNSKTFLAALAATTFLTAGIAFAADQAMTPPAQTPAQTAATKDAGKLSADGARAYLDVALTRLAIFDGRIDDAKKLVAEADSAFGKAKSDDSVFMKAESELRAPDQAKAAGSHDAANAKSAAAEEQTPAESEAARARMNATKQENSAKVYAGGKGDDAASRGQAPGTATTTPDMTTPKRWLPVDAEMSLNEDFTANPQKAAAVADANKKLAKGDKQGAMASLKLADVDIDYVMAVVPLDQTLADVHQAASLVDSGKYYEASQMLRQVQDSTRYDLLEVSGVPGAKTAPVTH